MIDIKPTPRLVKEIKRQIAFQQRHGYREGVAINTKWLETGQGCPIHGVPPSFDAVAIDTALCRGTIKT